jgi:hypothetical protein
MNLIQLIKTWPFKALDIKSLELANQGWWFKTEYNGRLYVTFVDDPFQP